ncbi:hypothetical protein F2Q68_00011239 [Brassica cretica]|uniref:Uncharacterized protein n=1 Tax=Brassica cretica TaxID=69181 RepID=A0A8S9KUK0_BRACR|nr:hypothetical protein F2Q68_00011239 [Brassica cretica]
MSFNVQAALCFPLGEPLSVFSGRHSMTRRLVLNLLLHGHVDGRYMARKSGSKVIGTWKLGSGTWKLEPGTQRNSSSDSSSLEALMAFRACYIAAGLLPADIDEPKIVEVGFEVGTQNRHEPTTVEHGATLPWGGVSSRVNHGSSEKKLFLAPRWLGLRDSAGIDVGPWGPSDPYLMVSATKVGLWVSMHGTMEGPKVVEA